MQRQSTLLRTIFNAAGKLSLQLCAQDIIVMPHGLNVVGSNKAFQPGPQNLEVHTIVKSVAENIALNRHNIGLVVSPQLAYTMFEASGRRAASTTVCKGQVVPFVEEKLFSENKESVTLSSRPRGIAVKNACPPRDITPPPQAADPQLGEQPEPAARKTNAEHESAARDALVTERDRHTRHSSQVSVPFPLRSTALIEDAQGGSVDGIIVESQLPRVCTREPQGSTFHIPDGVDYIVLDGDDAVTRCPAKPSRSIAGTQQRCQSAQQEQFELPILESIHFNVFVHITGGTFGVGRPDQQETKATEGSPRHRENETDDQEQSRRIDVERAQWHYNAESDSERTAEETRTEQATESQIEPVAAPQGFGFLTAGVLKTADITAEYIKEDPVKSVDLPSAGRRPEVDEILAGMGHNPPSNKVEMSKMLTSSACTPNEFDTIQEDPEQSTADLTTSAVELEVKESDSAADFARRIAEYQELTRVPDLGKDSILIDLTRGMLITPSRRGVWH